MGRTYTYEPEKISENGKDRMRFELGDTMVEGGSDTSVSYTHLTLPTIA